VYPITEKLRAIVRSKRQIVAAIAVAALMLAPDLAFAAAAGGGGMPYSAGLNTFKTSVTGEVAAIICLIGVVAGVAAYLYQGVLDHLMLKIVQVVIAVAIIGGAATFLTTMGVTGAVVG
jgi:type IV secretory pathway VirB2 component (pilin)